MPGELRGRDRDGPLPADRPRRLQVVRGGAARLGLPRSNRLSTTVGDGRVRTCRRGSAHEVGEAVAVRDLAPVASVGNAREPSSFTACWSRGRGPLRDARQGPGRSAGGAGTRVPHGPGARRLPRARARGRCGSTSPAGGLGRPFFVTEWVPGGCADTRLLHGPEPRAWCGPSPTNLASAAPACTPCDSGSFSASGVAATTVDHRPPASSPPGTACSSASTCTPPWCLRLRSTPRAGGPHLKYMHGGRLAN